MDDHCLVLNAGSSSLKFGVYGRDGDTGWQVVARGTIDGTRFSVRGPRGEVLDEVGLDAPIRDARIAVARCLDWLGARWAGMRVVGVGHRVVHGGASFAGPCRVTPSVLEGLRVLVPLAPLHQPANLDAIEVAGARLPGVPQVACFDTSFHRQWSEVVALVPLPKAIRDAGVRRYGFHGLSYEYVASVLPRVAPDVAAKRVLVAHLGNGASLCALRDGRSVDCSLGFTALDGLCMGTRPGSLDPGVVLHLIQAMGHSPAEVQTILYEQSGLLGISGISADMRRLAASSDPAARLAIDYFVHQAAKQIGALAAVLGGLDALVFTAGIGEHAADVRRRICDATAWLGVALDGDANLAHATRISSGESRVSVWVIPTDEERMLAQHTVAVLGLPGGFP